MTQEDLKQKAQNAGETPLKPMPGYRHKRCGSDRAELFNEPNLGAVCWGCGGLVVPVEEVERL